MQDMFDEQQSCSWFKGMPLSIFNHKFVMTSKVVKAMQCILGIPLKITFTHNKMCTISATGRHSGTASSIATSELLGPGSRV